MTGDNLQLGSWADWWETNKFDFIELRRVQDQPTRSQGSGRESALELESRLAGLRRMLRDDILPVLRELTDSSDPSVRAAAGVALGKLRDRDAVETVLGLLDDPSQAVRRSALISLGVMSDGRAAWSLMNVASDSARGRSLLDTRSSIPLDERGLALVAASLRGNPSVSILLEDLLGTSRRTTPDRLLALVADAAGLCGTTVMLRPLIDLAFDTSLSQQTRSAAATALGRIGDASVVPALMQLLESDLEPRRAATLALGLVSHSGERKVLERLGDLLRSDSDRTTRDFAAVSLGRIGGPHARSLLQAAWAKAGSAQSPWIALSLGLCQRADRGEDLAPTLLARLDKEGSLETQAAIAVALGLTRSELALAPLSELLRSGAGHIAAAAAMGLGLSGRAEAVPPLRSALASSTHTVVLRDAALAAGILGDSSMLPLLMDLLRRNNIEVSSHAAIGIALSGEAEAAGPLLDLIRREGPSGVTTTWAVAALGQLFDEDRRPALARLAAGDNYFARSEPVWALLDLGF